jgi:preprotein translocase subunit SecA
MFGRLIRKIIGTKNERELKRMRPIVEAINGLEPQMKKLSDAQLKAKTAEFKQRFEKGESLDDLLIETYAVVREASRRTLGERHFDVQLIGGIVLHRGKIAEMKTGEGKTLAATLPAYLNALEGKGVHIVTVNDYLAKRDAEWMGNIYNFLGLTVGVIVHGLTDKERKAAYQAHITYGQNNEFGFDYLRDNMKFSIYDYVQRDLHYAIVDEVDSILIDEARTPLIISGTAEESTQLYYHINGIIPSLTRDQHYVVDEKSHAVMLTEEGVEIVERKLGIKNLFDPTNIEYVHHVNQALRAHTLYKRDVHYMVNSQGQVIIIDEFTGRLMPGRRWSDGLHQAIEAKENVPIQEESRTLATITFQNYFRMYKKLAGMTGTADTEAVEFQKIYKLDVVVIPTNRPMIRIDYQDVIYRTEREKFQAVVNEVVECQKRGQPVLLGTISVEKSEAISRLLKKRGINHHVLNAKHHEREAEIIAQAGRKKAVTVSTNMAGRGTDIILGGNPKMLAKTRVDPKEEPEKYQELLKEFTKICKKEREEVIKAGGLHILGTERHESRRIDNQLRGRSGRQGDPGTSRFYLSLEDELLRIFGAERISGIMGRLGMEEGVPIEHKLVTRAIENAQKKVEARNFDIRKHLLEYDDVMNQQRKTIYELRRSVLEGRYEIQGNPQEELKIPPELEATTTPLLQEIVKQYFEDKEEDEPKYTLTTMERDIYHMFGVRVDLKKTDSNPQELLSLLQTQVNLSLTQQREMLLDIIDELSGELVDIYCPEGTHPEGWDLPGLADGIFQRFNIKIEEPFERTKNRLDIEEKTFEIVEKALKEREKNMDPVLLLRVFRYLYLEEIDRQWIDHLQNMDYLREGIGLRGYGQKDPKQEYKREGYDMFVAMMARIKQNVIEKLFRVQIQTQEDADRLPVRRRRRMRMERGDGAKPKTIKRTQPKVGRNAPCPCGSGKKYKKCCLLRQQMQA